MIVFVIWATLKSRLDRKVHNKHLQTLSNEDLATRPRNVHTNCTEKNYKTRCNS